VATKRNAKPAARDELFAGRAGGNGVRPIKPSPRSKKAILVGISAWTEPTLIKRGNFYPKGVSSAEDRLRFYASQFPIAEVDSTYYFPPSEQNAGLWAERTPPDFTFDVKAYSLLTNHPTKTDSLYKDLRNLCPVMSRESGTSTASTSPIRSWTRSGSVSPTLSCRCTRPGSWGWSCSSSPSGS